MKLLSSFLILGSTFAQEASGDGVAPDITPKNIDFESLTKSSFASLELVEPLYQECEAPEVCLNKIPARCRNKGESCAQSDRANNPCDYHCVTSCPEGEESIIVTGPSGGKFKKCVPLEEIRAMSNFICSAPEGSVPQFEMQVPKIIRHKYLEDNRNYTLVPFFDDNTVFSNSKCIQTEETEHFVIFRGSLEGRDECQINHWIEYQNDSLFDLYTGTIGYDDLTGTIGERQNVIYRKGAHYEFECRVKRTQTVTNDIFPFVDGRRPVTLLSDVTETDFEMVRCTDETCTEINTNGVIDISPDSMDDPMVFFKVEALTSGRYAHLRQCYYEFDSGDDVEKFDVIQNGCSANEPITILNQTRTEMGFDVFGQIMFMHENLDKTKVRVSCVVDACLPPAMGVYSCDVESACSGRYDEIYEIFGISNEVGFRKRRSLNSESFKERSNAIVSFDTMHPCYLISNGDEAEICPSDRNARCWTKEVCEEVFNVEIEVRSDAPAIASVFTLLLAAIFS